MHAQQKTESKGARRSIPMRAVNIVMVVLAAIVMVAFLQVTGRVVKANTAAQAAAEEHSAYQQSANDLLQASDHLTSNARLFVITGNEDYLDLYFEELTETRRREAAVEMIQDLPESTEASAHLRQALDISNRLARTEERAAKLVLAANGTPADEQPELLQSTTLSDADMRLSDADKRERAQQLLVDDRYNESKAEMAREVEEGTADLIESAQATKNANLETLDSLLSAQKVLAALLLAVVVLGALSTSQLVLWPLSVYTRRIRADEPLPARGSHELRYLADAYNAMFSEHRKHSERLQHKAEHDPLTQLANRGAYDALLAENDENIALLLVDIDNFKEFNDAYGHDVGDKVLQKVAESLRETFRSTDFPCRIGGDEFAVIMTDIGPSLAHVVEARIGHLRGLLADASGDVPQVTVSVGVAFSEGREGEADIYRAADKALYTVKDDGRDGYAFYGKDEVQHGR